MAVKIEVQVQSNHRFQLIQGGKVQPALLKARAVDDRRMEKAREEFFAMVRAAKAYNEARRVAAR